MTNELERALDKSDALSNAIACRLGHGDHGREGFATEIAVLEELEAERYQHIVAGLATANANLTDRLKEWRPRPEILWLLRSRQEPLTARCSGSEPMRAWPHGWLLNRPKTKDSLLSRRRWDVQGPSGSHLLREPLLGQTLRQQGQKGRISSSEEETRLCSEVGPEGKKATRR
jgi:hypothetical protein